MSDLAFYCFQYALALLLAPLLPGIIARIKAKVAGRHGKPVLQLYFDIFKGLRKGEVISQVTTPVFTLGPVVGLASVLCAVVGTYVVTRRLVIVGGGMAHASLGGVGMGAYFGFSPLCGAALFALVAGGVMRWLAGRRAVREDSAVAMLWTAGMAVGIMFIWPWA